MSTAEPSQHSSRAYDDKEAQLGDPWEVCNGYLKEHTKDLCESWRDEIDKLLIFAGLFSGVVTGFTIESYHAVKEDPAETTVALLRIISRQLDNLTHPSTEPISLEPGVRHIPSAALRINAFWFLSLAVSLSTVMAGIVCLQWIREYQRNANTSHREDVALHHMHLKGLRAWHVFKILSALPLLLIAALLLFFAGFIELLWEVDKISAILVAMVVGVAFLFIIITSIAPAVQYLDICARSRSQFNQCPYKSPQAWMIQWLVQKCIQGTAWVVQVFQGIPCMARTSKRKITISPSLYQISSWRSLDTFLRRRRDGDQIAQTKPRDVGLGLAWIGETFVQDQKLVEAVSRCLRDLEPNVALHSSLAKMDGPRAEIIKARLRRNSQSATKEQRSNTVFLSDLIVSHTLEHLAEKIEQGHMSPNLLHQRLDLFLKLNKNEGIREEVDCPVNASNVSLIERDKRVRVLGYIREMFKANMRCNNSHIVGGFEILHGMLTENPRESDVLPTLRDTLDELMTWIRHSGKGTISQAQERLKQGIMYTRLILVCTGSSDREIINGFRRQLDDHIRDTIMDGQPPPSSYQYPYLAHYMLSRHLAGLSEQVLTVPSA